MQQYAPHWHTEHMKIDRNHVPHVFHIKNRSTGADMRLAVHSNPCALCAALLAECVWPAYRIKYGLHFEVSEITDAPTSAPPEA